MKFLRISLSALVIFIVLTGLIIWAFSPVISRPFLSNALSQHNLQLHENSHIRLNPFTSRLTIRDLAWQGSDAKMFQLDSLSVSYSLAKLFSAKLHIADIQVTGVYAKYEQLKEQATALGFVLASDVEAAPQEEESEASKKQLNLALTKASFKDIELDMRIDGQQQNITIAELRLDDIQYDGTQASGYTHIRLATDLSANASKVALSVESKLDWSIDINEQTVISLNDSLLSLKDLQFQHNSYQANLADFVLKLDNLNAQLGDTTQINSNLSLQLNDMTVDDSNHIQLAAIDQINIPSIKVQSANQKHQLDIAELRFAEAQFASLVDANSTTNAPLAKFNHLQINNISTQVNQKANHTQLSVESVLLDALAAYMKIDQQGNLVPLSTLQSVKQTAPEEAEQELEADTALPAQFEFAIGEFAFTSPATLKVFDTSITPSFDKGYVIDELSVKDISNMDEEQSLSFAVSLKDEDYFTYKLQGDATAFNEPLNLHLSSSIKQLAIHEISPYVHKALGFGVQTGQLDSDVQVTVTDNALDGNIKLLLRGTSFAANKANTENELDMLGKTSIPLNAALNMLKDKNGNIELTIPVDGDINDPNFGVQYIIGLVVKKAVMSQAKKHLINTFVPYGQILSVAYSAGSYALKVRFEDLIYAPAQISPSEAQIEFVDQFIALLQKKPKLQVKVCPIASLSELPAELKHESDKDEQKQWLVDIATKRGAEFKRLVSDTGIEPSRLLICSPEIDASDKAKPRIKLSV